MGLFIIYQEAFYRAMAQSRIIRSLRMPNRTENTLLEYADDSNILISSERALIEVNNIISLFEKATGAILNRNNNTKIFGMSHKIPSDTVKLLNQMPYQ